MLTCPQCGHDGQIANECGCDPNNMPTALPTTTVHRYEDPAPGAWQRFLDAMHSGQVFECDEEMYFYWLEVLPPAFMGRAVALPTGRTVRATFGFAEGAEPVTAFWKEGDRYFGCRTSVMNPHA